MKSKTKWTVLLSSGAFVLVVGAVVGRSVLDVSTPPKFEAIDITGVEWGRDFKLTDHTGRTRMLSDFRGKAVAVFFGFANCPDICPTTMAKLGEVMKLLGEDSSKVQVLFITVDPKRDTREVLSQYVPAFHPTFLGLYSDPETTARTAKEFKVYYQLQPPNEHGSYSVDHSGQIFVFDPEGRLRLLMKPDLPPETMAHDFRVLLR